MTKYRPDIDGLRAIAVLAVVAFHAAPKAFPGGFIGVDVFFAISGYLITSILLANLAGGDFSIAAFYVRRIKRLFPALLVVLVACLAFGWFFLVADEYEKLGQHVAAGAGFSSNLVLWNESGYFDDSSNSKILLHLWSLGIEEQFYIWWPLILWWTWTRSASVRTVAAVIAIASFAIGVALVFRNPDAAYYSPFGRAWELLVGALLACIAVQRGAEQSVAAGNALSVAGAVLLAAGFATVDSSLRFPGWVALLPVVGTTLMIAAGPAAWINRHLLASRMLVWFGLVSYPLYLWHWPILTYARILNGSALAPAIAATAVLAAVLLAWLTFRWIEMPIRNSGSGGKVASSLAIAMAVVGLSGWVVYVQSGLPERSAATRRPLMAGDIGHRAYFTYIRDHDVLCTPAEFRDSAERWQDLPRCFQSKANPVHDVAILGDSHGEQLFAGLAAKLPDRNVVFYGDPTAPLARGARFEKIFQYVLHDPNIRTVVLSARWPVRLKDESDEQVRSALSKTVQALASAGKTVFIATDVPTFSFAPEACKYAGRLGQANRCSEPDSHSMARYAPIFESVASGDPHVTVVDTYGYFCKAGTCAMAGNGTLYFRDDNHLNVDGSKAVADLFVDRIQ